MMRFLRFTVLFSLVALHGTAAYADKKADALLLRAEHLIQQAHTFQAELLEEENTAETVAQLHLSRPDSLAFTSTDAKGNKSLLVGNSKRLINYEEKQHNGNVLPLEELFFIGDFMPQFFFLTSFLEPGLYHLLEQPVYVGQRQHRGKKYEVVVCPAVGERSAWTLYFASSGLLEGIEAKADSSKHFPATGVWLHNIRLNQLMPPAMFAFTPPTGTVMADSNDPAAELPPVGSPAPDFAMPLLRGENVTRDGLLKGKKALLLTISFYECGACVGEIPALKRLYADLKDKGLALLDVNIMNNRQDAQKVVSKYAIPYPVGLDDVSGGGKAEVVSRYHADAGGTNILIGADGKILWCSSGLNEKHLRCLLANLGIPALPGETTGK